MNIFEVIFLFKISKDLKKLLQKLSQLFEKVVAPDKFTSTVWNRYSWFCQNCDLSFFCHICKYFWGYVPFCDFGTIKSTKKIIAALWERCCIRQIYFHCFKDMLMFFTKLWFKFFFLSHLWTFSRLCFLFTILPTKKPPQNCHSSL